MKKIVICLFSLTMLTGCASLDELLVLKDVAEEQESIDQYVTQKDELFAQLVTAVQTDKIEQFSTKTSIQQRFGEPIRIYAASQDSQQLEKWFYRKTVDFFDSDKIYLYFDSAGKLTRWEYIPRGQDGQIKSKT